MNPNDLQSVWLYEYEKQMGEERIHCEECSGEADVECCMEGHWLCRDCLDMSECKHCGYMHCPVKHEAKFDLK
jgi:hypothetical protein